MNILAKKPVTKQYPTTTQKLLWDLNECMPITMIVEHTQLTREQIWLAAEGAENDKGEQGFDHQEGSGELQGKDQPGKNKKVLGPLVGAQGP